MLRRAGGTGEIPLQQGLQGRGWPPFLQDEEVLPAKGYRWLLGMRRFRDVRQAGFPKAVSCGCPHKEPESNQQEGRQRIPRRTKVLVTHTTLSARYHRKRRAPISFPTRQEAKTMALLGQDRGADI